MKKLTKKQIGLLVGAGIILAGVGGTIAYSQVQKNNDIIAKEQVAEGLMSDLKKLDNSILELLDTEDQNFLAKDVTDEQVETIRQQVKLITEPNYKFDDNDKGKAFIDYKTQVKTVEKDFEKVEKAYKTQQTVNSLFQTTEEQKALNGKEINLDLPISDDLSQETLSQAKTEYYKENGTSDYEKTINSLIQTAEDQFNQISKAKEEVAKLYVDGQIISTDTATYDVAKAETEKIKNEKAKNELVDQLNVVKADIDKKATEEAQAKTAEEQKQAEQTTANPATNDTATNQAQGAGNSTANNGNGSNNAPSSANANTGGTPTAGGSTGNGNSGGSTGNGNSGGSGGTTIPAGWIVPPYPIGSDDLWNWLIDNGYSGFDSSDGYIRPY